MGFLSDGKLKEKEFLELVTKPTHKVVLPTTNEDINEHWDLSIDGVKFDVTGLKKVKRSDDNLDPEIHWVELENVHGKLGWLYGKADYIAFETNNSWLIVCRLSLIKLIDDNLKLMITAEPEIYKMYRRWGRYDVLTIVPTNDLRKIKTKEILKYG
jgi:hypothetical protein